MPTIENLFLENFSFDNVLESYQLNADAAAGQPAIVLLAAPNLADGQYLCLVPGEEIGELLQIKTPGVSGQTITLATNLALLHRNHEKVVRLFGSQIRVYKAANVDGTPPSDATFINGGVFATVNIDPSQSYSSYTDNNGGSGYWYKFTYYNPTTTAETDISLAEAVRGGGYGHYVSIQDIRNEAGQEDTRRIEATDIAGRRDESEDEIKGALAAAGYILPLQTQNGVLYTPRHIRNIAKLLSAGSVLLKNFGTTKPGSSKNGQAKVDEARHMLAKIQLNDVVLLDSNEQMLAKPSLVSGWPDETTMDNGFDVGPVVTMDKIF